MVTKPGQEYWSYDPVAKKKGYSFDGIIRSAFMTGAGEWRYVVEHETIVGMLHIFSGEQLQRRL